MLTRMMLVQASQHAGTTQNWDGTALPWPPFAVGDIIMSDVGKHGLQRAFVLKLDHPQYQLRLESEVTVGRFMVEAFLIPRLSGLALDQGDPFAKIRGQVKQGKSGIGSYSVHGDARQ